MISVALDEYLRRASAAPVAATAAPVGGASEGGSPVPPKRQRKGGKSAASAGESEPDKWAYLRGSEPPDGPDRWKWFDSPDVWPQVDPDPVWQVEFELMTKGLDSTADAVMEQVDKAYWATRERPPW